MRELARTQGRALQAADIVTTGTLTEALPAISGQWWRAQVDTVPLADIEIRLG